MGGVPPIGYSIENRRLIPNTEETKTAQFIFIRYLELGSVGKLKRELDNKGIKSPIRISQKGNKYGGVNFSRGALYKILKNPAYKLPLLWGIADYIL
ncbi:MAG: recombinase family protein [Pseudomonadota bacterium]